MHLIEMEIDPEINFFCPMTGEPVFSPEGFQTSEAMTFAYSADAGEFEVIQPWAKKIWDAIESKASEDEMPEELFDKFLAKFKKHPNLVAFRFLCDGSFSSETLICFDFAHGTYDPDEENVETPAPKKKSMKKKPSKKVKKRRR
jgi:hypothetical protein